MRNPGNQTHLLHTLAGVLCLLPLSAGAVVVDTDPPDSIVGFQNPVLVNATLPVYVLDLASEIGIDPTAKITVTDRIGLDTFDYIFSPEGSLGPLLPGVYTIDWTATDLGFNSRTEPQTLNVLPSVNLELSQTVGEGGTAVVTAHLSGKAPSYPVTIPYTVTNNAPTDATDHGAGAGGNFVFNADETETSISFVITDDGAGDAGETITISFGALPAEVFSGHNLSHTITITETNIAPLAQLHAEQNGNTTRAITTDGGTVTIYSNAYDANGDTIAYDWSASDNALAPTAGTTGSTFTFEPAGLSAGLYTLRLTVSDGSASSTHDLLLRLIDTAITLTDDTDSDQDNSGTGDDATEGIHDDDNDGIPNYVDAIEANPTLMQGYEPYTFDPDLIVGNTMVVDSITLEWSIDHYASNIVIYPLLISTDPGHEIHLGPTVFATSRSYARITSNTAETLRGLDLPDGMVSSDGQVIDVEITNLSQVGGTAQIIVPMVAPIPAPQTGAPEFIVFSNVKTWETFTADANNVIRTNANKDADGYCPALGTPIQNTANYPNSLQAGEECLLITIEDGGPNDYDGFANGSVRFMGGVFISSASTPLEQESGSGVFTGDTEASTESLNKLDLGSGGGGTLDLVSLLGLLLLPRLRRKQI